MSLIAETECAFQSEMPWTPSPVSLHSSESTAPSCTPKTEKVKNREPTIHAKSGRGRREVRRIIDALVSAAARAACTTEKDIRSNSRFREHVRCRQAIIRVAVERGCSYAQIGRNLNRHHTSVASAYEVSKIFMARDEWFRKLVRRLEFAV